MRHFLRLCSITASHRGACTGKLGWKGPYAPCSHGQPQSVPPQLGREVVFPWPGSDSDRRPRSSKGAP